jgi:hypothetical protein
MAAITNDSPCRNLAFATWTGLGPRFARHFGDLNARRLASRAGRGVGASDGALWMGAVARVGCLAAYGTNTSQWNRLDDDWFFFAQGVLLQKIKHQLRTAGNSARESIAHAFKP